MPDTYNLQRFVDAQEPVFDTALAELKQGRKRGHWIWFIFPQLKDWVTARTRRSTESQDYRRRLRL